MNEVEKLDAYFRAANYLSVGQLYLLDNPLLDRPLEKKDLKKKIVGHWGTVPGQNFIYTHLNRVIKKYDLNMMYISGPGHGGNFMIANTYLEGSYTDTYPEITRDKEGMKKLFKQFSFPKGVSSHVAPETPGSIHEGGELGYSLSHAYGAVLDNPDLIAVCVVGDGEAETGPLATSWHGNKFINKNTDGVVLPILHLNGYKISNPTVFSRMSNKEIASFFYGCGYDPYLVEGNEKMKLHKVMMITMDKIIEQIKAIKSSNSSEIPRWPMIILKTPKGWTGPKVVDGKKIEGTFRAHQVPITMEKEEHIKLLEDWLKSYKPEELFDENGRPVETVLENCPDGNSRMGSNINTNGGLILKELVLPDFKNYKVNVITPGETLAQDTLVLSNYVRDIFKYNKDNFRMFGPDETMSNRFYSVFEETNRSWQMDTYLDDEYLSKSGRIIDSMLSEHLCEGLLEGYLLTGRHGFFASYEAFIRIIDSMVSQHAKWLKVCNEISWRKPIASLNLLLASNVWQQDHNGYTHQDPGFLDHIANKKVGVVRMYLPPDANCLLSCFDHTIRSKNYVNVIVASKHPSHQWLNINEAVEHCTKGIGIWPFVTNSDNPDFIMASAGDTPTLEAIAAISIIKRYFPEVKYRFVNVVDLMKLDSSSNHPHALTNDEYDELFTKDKPIVFAYHGYPTLIHELTYFRNNRNISVHGYNEEGTITTPFDMRVQNKIDRFNLVIDIINHLDLKEKGEMVINIMKDKINAHNIYIAEHGEDMEEIKNWKWH
ncbi:MAG: phosphoketolase family protein [Bacilli bacterium]